jgi:hypothetical protein
LHGHCLAGAQHNTAQNSTGGDKRASAFSWKKLPWYIQYNTIQIQFIDAPRITRKGNYYNLTNVNVNLYISQDMS